MPDGRSKTSAAEIAREWNHWIKYDGAWYSPDEFEQWHFDHPNEYDKGKTIYLNPYRELRNGLQTITQMITERKDPVLVAEAIKKAQDFANKIKNAGSNPLDPPGVRQSFDDWPVIISPEKESKRRG